MLLRSEVLPGQTIKVDAKKDGLKFTVQTKKIKNTDNNQKVKFVCIVINKCFIKKDMKQKMIKC